MTPEPENIGDIYRIVPDDSSVPVAYGAAYPVIIEDEDLSPKAMRRDMLWRLMLDDGEAYDWGFDITNGHLELVRRNPLPALPGTFVPEHAIAGPVRPGEADETAEG